MLLSWHIRFVDSRERCFKDRHLLLDTATLDTRTRAAVELAVEVDPASDYRTLIPYRHLFTESADLAASPAELAALPMSMRTFTIAGYFEDETGTALSPRSMARALTGNANAAMFPAGTKEHHIRFALAPVRPVSALGVSIPQNELDALAYFKRDLEELKTNSLFLEQRITLSGSEHSPGVVVVQTSSSSDQIRAFVSIFRRLAVTQEPGNFPNAAGIICRRFPGYPVTDWIARVVQEYRELLSSEPDLVPSIGHGQLPCTIKELLECYLYTRYMHQDQHRLTQYHSLLQAVNGHDGALMFHFLCAARELAHCVANAGVEIVRLYTLYCEVNGVSGAPLLPLEREHPEIGSRECPTKRRQRMLRIHTERLAHSLWKERGEPQGGAQQFFDEAEESLRNTLPIES
jgi:hypothetical protein